jgi:eukaryotic-like serine/threonine-protein kinase
MNSRFQQPPFATANHVTVLEPAAEAGARAKVCCPNREIANATGPHLTQETQALLRTRLRAAAFILLLGFGLFLVRHIGGALMGEPLSPVLLTFHILIVLVLSVCAAPLCRSCSVSLGKLRVAELVIFGLPTAFFLMVQHKMTLQDAARGFQTPPLSLWLLLFFTYGMFIPNTWRRAALVIGIVALAPLVLLFGMMAEYPEVAGVMTVIGVMTHVLVMSVAAVAAVFGTHLINTLRREVQEAKELGQYRLMAPLGAGGMGEVHLAEHRMLKRPCAIKLIRPDQAGDPLTLARFEREVQMTARLSHWNTIEIYDYGRTDDGTFFYVMEYLPGLSLEDLLDRHGPLSAERVVHLLRQTCQGLREAHGIGLIHRDIKPGNIFAAQRGGLYDVAKLLDFGLVKPLAEIPSTRLTIDGSISGTPLYMSPEQARGLADADARSDIYSLGAVAYALLTGHPPFERGSPMEVMIAHARDEVVPPSRLQPDLPADLEQVVLRCMAKKPVDRFPDIGSLQQALADCAAADRWTQTDAERWWHEHDRAAMPEASVAATV